MRNFSPPQKPYRAGKSNYFFMILQLISFALSLVATVYAITQYVFWSPLCSRLLPVNVNSSEITVSPRLFISFCHLLLCLQPHVTVGIAFLSIEKIVAL